MSDITDDAGFKQALQGLDHTEQRLLAARYVENVMSLATDDRIGHTVADAGNLDAGSTALAEAVHSASHAGGQAGGPAWQAAISARMARTARSIDTDEDCAGQERLSQYSLLSDFLNSR